MTDVRARWPAGLRRETAAEYVGISPGKFDDWVERGLMPPPKRQDGVVVWLRWALDEALAALPEQGGTKLNPYRDIAL